MSNAALRFNAPPKPKLYRLDWGMELDVENVVLAPDVAIWDIRPYEERMGEPGFIPGSRSFPLEPETVMRLPWDSILGENQRLILCCLSGRRSRALVDKLQVAGYSGVSSLSGGVLAWQEAGKPLVVPNPAEPEEHLCIERLDQLPRAVLSCFIAESSQTRMSVEDAPEIDPSEVVSHIFSRPDAVSCRERALDTLDVLGESARRLGHTIEQMACNLNAMRATVQRIAPMGPDRSSEQ